MTFGALGAVEWKSLVGHERFQGFNEIEARSVGGLLQEMEGLGAHGFPHAATKAMPIVIDHRRKRAFVNDCLFVVQARSSCPPCRPER